MKDLIYDIKRVICISLWIILVVLLLTGCKSVPVTPPPVLAQCDTMCYSPCVDEKGNTGLVWEVSGTQAEDWDKLAEIVVTDLSTKLRQCDKARQACTKCLDRLELQGIIKQ